jgi:GTP 3',8-cyclase
MIDGFGRKITKLRVSVTDKCNLRCKYCMPKNKVKWMPREDILSLEEIAEVVGVASELGINKVRLTGGEPLVRRNIIKLIKMIRDIKGIDDIAITTNGILLAEYAKELVEAGLDRVNISLDAVDPDRFSEITGGGDVTKVFQGIDAAIKAGLKPIKINCVVRKSSDEADAKAVKAYADSKNLKTRFIRLMNLKTGDFSVVEGGEGGNCEICNRMRLLSDGTIRPCLFSDIGFNVRKHGIKEAFELAAKHKPKMGGSCLQHWMHSIGG